MHLHSVVEVGTAAAQRSLLPAIFASWRFWPVINFISFKFVPLPYRLDSCYLCHCLLYRLSLLSIAKTNLFIMLLLLTLFRVLVSNVASIFWNIYMSKMANA